MTVHDGVQTGAAELETARRWAVRLEGELARAKEAVQSQEILRERAEADRDTALGRLASCGYEVSAFRHQRDQAVAARDEVLVVLSDLLAAVDVVTLADPTHYEVATAVALPAIIARQRVEAGRRQRVVPPDAHEMG